MSEINLGIEVLVTGALFGGLFIGFGISKIINSNKQNEQNKNETE